MKLEQENLKLRELLASTLYTLNECVNTIHEHQHNDRHLKQIEADARLVVWEVEDELGNYDLYNK